MVTNPSKIDCKTYFIWLEQVLNAQKIHTNEFIHNLHQQLEAHKIAPKQVYSLKEQILLPEEIFLKLVNQAEILMHSLWTLFSYHKSQLSNIVDNKKLYGIFVDIKTHPLMKDFFSKHSYFCAKGLINICHTYKNLNEIIRVPGTNSIMSDIYNFNENNMVVSAKSIYEVYPEIVTGTNEQHWLGKIADAVCLRASDSRKVKMRCEMISSLVSRNAFAKLKEQDHFSIMENATGTGENSVMVLKKLEQMGIDINRVHILAMDIDQNSIDEFQRRLDDKDSDYFKYRNCFTLAKGNINKLDAIKSAHYIQANYPSPNLKYFLKDNQLCVDTLMQTGIDDYLNLEFAFEHPVASKCRIWLHRNILHRPDKNYCDINCQKANISNNKLPKTISLMLRNLLNSNNFAIFSKNLVVPNFNSRADLIKKDGFYISASFAKEDYDQELHELANIIKDADGKCALEKVRSLFNNNPAEKNIDNKFKNLSSDGGRIGCMLWFLNYQSADYMQTLLNQAGLKPLTKHEYLQNLVGFEDLINHDSLDKNTIHTNEGLYIFAMKK